VGVGLPPPGPLAFVCEWPTRHIPETRAEIDASLVLEAAARAVAIWPDELIEEAGVLPIRVRRRQQVAGEPQPSSRAGSSRQGVEVRAMYTIAARQAGRRWCGAGRRRVGRAGPAARTRLSPTAGLARGRKQGSS